MADQRKTPSSGANSGSTSGSSSTPNSSTTADKSASAGSQTGSSTGGSQTGSTQSSGAQGGAQTGAKAGAPTGTPTSKPTGTQTGAGQSGSMQGSSTQSGSMQGGGSMIDDAKDTAHHLADQVQQKATTRVHSTLNQGKTRAADALGSAAQTLLNSTQQMRDQKNQSAQQGGAPGDAKAAVLDAEHGASEYVERAAHQMQQLSDYLKNTDVNEIVHRVEQTARRQPALFLGGAFAIGLIGARFLKSSHRDLQQQNDRNMNTSDRYSAAYGSMYRNSPQDSGMRNTGMYSGGMSGDRDVTSQRGIAIETSRTGTAASTGSTATSGTAGSSGATSGGTSGQQRNSGESSSGTGGTGATNR